MLSGLISFAIFPTYPGPGCHNPDISGWPSAVFGAGADRFGLPSGVRGIPAVGYLSHCGVGDAAITNAAMNIAKAFMAILLGLVSCTDYRCGVKTFQIKLQENNCSGGL